MERKRTRKNPTSQHRRTAKQTGLFLIYIFLAFTCFFPVSGCSADKPTAAFTKETASVTVPVRDNTPHVRIPEASGEVVWDSDGYRVDLSHTDQGYLMVQNTGISDKLNIQIIGPDEVAYHYFLEVSDRYTALPFTAGNGTYTIRVLKRLSGTKYSLLCADQVEVTLENEFLPFLYPNQYVDFDDSCQAVSVAASLAENAADDLAVVQAVFDYTVSHITYDYDKAAHIQSGYLPVVDDTLESGTGICFDYAALMVAMLRSQSIPTRLDIGYAEDIYHAWISVYIENIGWISGIIRFDGYDWTLLDPTFASTGQNSQECLEYMADTTHYDICYVH